MALFQNQKALLSSNRFCKQTSRSNERWIHLVPTFPREQKQKSETNKNM